MIGVSVDERAELARAGELRLFDRLPELAGASVAEYWALDEDEAGRVVAGGYDAACVEFVTMACAVRDHGLENMVGEFYARGGDRYGA